MKAIKITLSIVGFALTSISFGQLLSQSDGSLLFYTVKFNPTNNQIEHHLEEYPARWTSGDQYETPLSASTYFAPLESELVVEDWMIEPFESNYYEPGPMMEDWMIEPFESNYYEPGPMMEDWMIEPFADSYYEEDPVIETWMIEPFETFDDLEMEDWMTSSWI